MTNDAEQDNKLYQCVRSIIGIEKGIQKEHRHDLDAHLRGAAKRLSELLITLDVDERTYWQTHLRKQRLQAGLNQAWSLAFIEYGGRDGL